MKEFLKIIGVLFLFWVFIVATTLTIYTMDEIAYRNCIQSGKPLWFCKYLIRD